MPTIEELIADHAGEWLDHVSPDDRARVPMRYVGYILSLIEEIKEELTARERKHEESKMEGFQVTMSFKDGATPQDIAAKMRFQAGLFEGMTGSEASSRKNTDAPKKVAPKKVEPEVEADDVDEDEDEDFAPKKVNVSAKAKAKAAAFDDDDDETDADEEEEEVAPVKKAKAKAKKITMDEVNEACKARAASTGGKEGRAEVLGILKKKFKVESVSDVEPEQYAAVIAAMEV